MQNYSMIASPSLILCDEPFLGLDEILKIFITIF
jgi:ABC-type multidrug transport system ATPase subunit